MWHESGCSCCWWSQWHCQKLSLIAFFLSLNLQCLLELLLQLASTEMLCFIHCKRKLEAFLHLSIFIKGKYYLSKGKKLCHVIIAWFSYAPSVYERASIFLISGADWQRSYIYYLCMSERSALAWICRCCRLETEVLTWSDFGWAGNLLLDVESATRSKLAVLKGKLSVLEQQLE